MAASRHTAAGDPASSAGNPSSRPRRLFGFPAVRRSAVAPEPLRKSAHAAGTMVPFGSAHSEGQAAAAAAAEAKAVSADVALEMDLLLSELESEVQTRYRADTLAHLDAHLRRHAAGGVTLARRPHSAAHTRRRKRPAAALLIPDDALRLAAEAAGIPEVAFAAPRLGLPGLALTHPLRRPFVRLKLHRAFEAVALLAVLANCVVLALHDPKEPHDSARATALDDANKAFTIIFLVEILLSVAAAGGTAYIKDPSHWIDLVVVGTGVHQPDLAACSCV